MIARRSFITGLIALVAGFSAKREMILAYVAPQVEMDFRWTFEPPSRTEWIMLQQKGPYIAEAGSFEGGIGYFGILIDYSEDA